MYYYLCVKQPENEENPFSISANMFITYSFGNTVTNQYVNGRKYAFTLGYIYRTQVKKFIMDENGKRHRIQDVSEYLKPYDFKIDEDAERLIRMKEEKGDTINIYPIKLNTNGRISYECECKTVDKKGILHHNFVVLTFSQADVIRECYRIMRKQDKSTIFWRDFFYDEIRDYNIKHRLGLL